MEAYGDVRTRLLLLSFSSILAWAAMAAGAVVLEVDRAGGQTGQT